MVAVILAAGRGTRMGELTINTPKPLLPVLKKDAVKWVIDGAIAAGIGRAIIVTGYLGKMVVDALRDYRAGEITLQFIQQDVQAGTADAMGRTAAAAAGEDVLLAFADIITSPENFSAMVDTFYHDDCALTAAVRDAGDPWRAAAVYVDSEMAISHIIEKPVPGTSTTPWSHAGMYCFSNQVYDYVYRVKPSPRGEYEVTDAVQMMIADGLRCRAVELKGYWKDLATPDDIAAAEELIMKDKLARSPL